MTLAIPNTHYLIIDLEATCADDGSIPREEMEIIEIGAVMQNARTFEIETEFQTFVRPTLHTTLTPFCRQLTSIAQEQVDAAPPFPTALAQLNEWRLPFDAMFCSWGDYDARQIRLDCVRHGVRYPFENHLNVKAAVACLNVRKEGLGQSLRRLGLEFEGTPHRGIDDARNIARLVKQVCLL